MRYVTAAARGIRRGATSVARAVPVLARDCIGLVGAASIVYGIAQIHVPAAYIVGGLMLMWAAFALAGRAN
ncbi:hypothetical protein GGQ99_004784 [Aminobacter niigataensis]|uniref:Uncharacterized protein n=1 Tax=Aminobacter niigataensis TaxID=83265 RepID=A0ABR6L873_9HYPH|nr:hypothetical protein [Aminobacter niigataensis]MBB4653000.1 hypothetical protein [Aminobacter niigataensis]